MAEISKPSSRMALWPTLKKKLGDAVKRKKHQKKANPFALQGLEKFAVVVAELQAKNSSLVDKTGNSVSAVRYLSRSAQEWTASTIARTASRHMDMFRKSSSPGILLLQHSHSQESVSEIDTVDFSQSFSNPKSDYGFDSNVFGDDLQGEADSVSDSLLDSDSDSVTEDSFVSEPCCTEVGYTGIMKTSGTPTSSARLLIRHGRLLLLEKGWARSSNSAVALFLAVSACVVARVTTIGISFFELLTIDFVVKWQRGKLYADFLQSLVTRHIVPHLSIRVPRGLALLPLVRRKRTTSELVEPIPQRSEVELEPEPDSVRNSFPVLPELLSLDYPTIPQLRAAVALETSPSEKISSTRQLVRKLKAKMSKSSTPGSADSPHSHSSCTSSRKISNKNSFACTGKEKDVSSDDGWPNDVVFADSGSSVKKRCILYRKCSFRKEKSSEVGTSMRRSPLGRTFSMETLAVFEMTSAFQKPRHTATSVFASGRNNFDLCLVLGILVALLFLVVNRLSAVVATSLLIFIFSYAQTRTVTTECRARRLRDRCRGFVEVSTVLLGRKFR